MRVSVLCRHYQYECLLSINDSVTRNINLIPVTIHLQIYHNIHHHHRYHRYRHQIPPNYYMGNGKRLTTECPLEAFMSSTPQAKEAELAELLLISSDKQQQQQQQRQRRRQVSNPPQTHRRQRRQLLASSSSMIITPKNAASLASRLGSLDRKGFSSNGR
jgi:hypothetical protein